jgi:DNA-binding LytR/AlgR family response regulator
MDAFKILKAYFGQNLGNFYTHPTNRMLIYPFFFSFFLIECGTFWVLYLGPAFVMDFLAFTTVFTLHKAGVYTICIWTADLVANHLPFSWGTYGNRNVGRQWLIWSLGLGVGFAIQRTMIRSLVPIYAPDVVAYFIANPLARLSTSTLLMILIPYWLVVVFVTLRVVLSRQRIQRLADSIVVSPGHRSAETVSATVEGKGRASGMLRLNGDSGGSAIALSDITHVTVEDHYCRVNYIAGNGLKSEMIRLPLKQMLRKLPDNRFVQIHRSHVVNSEHISHLAKNGRDHNVVLEEYGVVLPVSRSRFKHLPQCCKIRRTTAPRHQG